VLRRCRPEICAVTALICIRNLVYWTYALTDYCAIKHNKAIAFMEHLFPSPSLKGSLLMAMPLLMDPNFRHSVICITEHTDDGAVGIVVNQVYEGLHAKMVFDELEIACRGKADSIPVFVGGPVHTDELFILHGPPLDWTESLKISEHLALSNSRAILEAIAQGNGPRDFLISLGCAGWAPGQLEWEMSQNAWLVTACDDDILFKVPPGERWNRAIECLGIDPHALSGTPGHA
jgi:putative transcriptional regulator